MFDYNKLEMLSSGEAKLKYIKKGIDEAQKAKDFEAALYLMHEYIEESVFNDDNFKALIMFPEYMALFDANPDLHNPYRFMTAFKWIIEDITDFYQISVEKAEEYFCEFEKRCKQYGYSLRTLYMKKMHFYSQISPDKTRYYQKKFRESERDNLSDCYACETNSDICMELEFGSEEKALKMLRNMVNNGISCAEVPQVTYGKCVEHFTATGNLDEAEYYAEKLLPMIKGNNNFLMEVSHIMLLKSYTNPNKALKIFENNLETFVKCKNPKMRFYFADAAARFFGILAESDITSVTMRLPHTFSLYHSDNEYTSSEMKSYFGNLAQVIAEKFDERNGNTYYSDILNYEYPSEPVSELDLPAHGTSERRPSIIAVPFKSDESLPSPQDIFESLSSEYEVTNVGYDDENNTLTVSLYVKELDTETTVKILITDIEDSEEFMSLHKISENDMKEFIDEYRIMAVISTMYDEGIEGELYSMLLKIADRFNTDNSPVIININHGLLLSSKWVKLETESSIPPLENSMFRVHAYPSDMEEGYIDFVTSGLSQYGSKEIAAFKVKQQNIPLAFNIISQIAASVCSIESLRDEGDTSYLGTTYNEESEVLFSWTFPEKAYTDYDGEFPDYVAVPIIYLSASDADNQKGVLINEISETINDLFQFKRTNRDISMEETKANERFLYALEKFRNTENSRLIVGCYADIPEEYQDEYGESCMFYVNVESADGEKITGTITEGIEVIDILKTGQNTVVFPERVFFWRLDIDDERYFADDTYIFI